MALADLDRFLLMRETEPALHERLARPMDLEGFLALAWLSLAGELHHIGSFPVHFPDPAGMGDGAVVGVENPGIVG